MNRIKIIKRAGLHPTREACETEMKKVNHTVIKPQARKVVEHWIDEWRASQPENSRHAFAALFGNSPPVSG